MRLFWGVLLGLVPNSQSQMIPVSPSLRCLGVQVCTMDGSLLSLRFTDVLMYRKSESHAWPWWFLTLVVFVIFCSSRTWDKGRPCFHVFYLSTGAGSITINLREALCKSLHLSNDKSLPADRFCAVSTLFDFVLNKSPVRSMIIDSISQNQFFPSSA